MSILLCFDMKFPYNTFALLMLSDYPVHTIIADFQANLPNFTGLQCMQ